jgi:hypothetical protein
MERTEAFPSQLDLFSAPPLDAGVKHTQWVDYTAQGDLGRDASFMFDIPNNASNYIDMKKTRLRVKLELKKEFRHPETNVVMITDVVPTDKVGLINLSLQSLWSQVDVSLQHVLISKGTQSHYSFKALMDTILMREEDNTYESLESQLFFKDSPGAMDQPDPNAWENPPSNTGLLTRYNFTKNGSSVDLEGPLFIDLFQQDRPLLNNVRINVKLWPNKDAFRLMAADPGVTYFINISYIRLRVCHIHVSDKLLLQHDQELKKGRPALYPHIRSDVRAFNIPKGQLSHQIEDLYKTELPEKLLVALVSAASYSGRYELNPYNFQHYNLNSIEFNVDGNLLPTPALQPDFAQNNFVDAFSSLGSGFDALGRSDYMSISRTDFPRGYALYLFDLSSDARKRGMTVKSLKGHARLQMRFETPIPEAVTVLIYSQFPSIMTIDGARNVTI